MGKKIRVWAIGDDNKANKFIKNNFWEIGFNTNLDGFKKNIKNLNEIATNDVVVLKSKYVNPQTKENYLKVFAIGIVLGIKEEKSFNIRWIKNYTTDSNGFKKINGVIYGKTLEAIKKDESIKKIFDESLNDFIKDNNLLNIRGDKIFNFGEVSFKLKDDINKENDLLNNIKQPKPLNQILYGPPGTGKTYKTIDIALEIIFEKENPREEFEFKIKDKNGKEKAVKKSYNNILELEENERRKHLQGFFDYFKTTQEQIEFITFHQSYAYEEFIEGIKAETNQETKNIEYEIKPGIFKQLCEKASTDIDEKIEAKLSAVSIDNKKYNELKDTNDKNYILIIDEINRGKPSKIFGELITLIETSKRIGTEEEIRVKLPYSNNLFGVPKNLYIIGTMNTADRSIALMDTALRRRFDFREMMPQPELLNDIIVEEINIRSLLETINKRIEYLYDRDHTIGHAYFMSLKSKSGREAKSELYNIFRNKIIPLLQEYFYDNWEKIRLILGDNQKNDEDTQFIKIKQGYKPQNLFGDKGLDSLDLEDEVSVYEINEIAFDKSESYIKSI